MNKQTVKTTIAKAKATHGIARVRLAIAAQRFAKKCRYAGRSDDAFEAHCLLSMTSVLTHADKSEKGRAIAESRAIGWM